MDYDRTDIPAAYDRGRGLSGEVVALWMRALGGHLQDLEVVRILDLGCGTGRFAEALASHFKADVIGIDPSAKMLDQARRKRSHPHVRYQRGYAEAIPLRSASVDVIFISMSLHHFHNRGLVGEECRRVLRTHGVVFVRTGTREHISSYPYVGFFPSVRSMLEELLPDHRSLRRAFENAGFHMASHEAITQTIATDWNAYADRLAAGGDSVLARLSSDEFERGLAAIRQRRAQDMKPGIREPIDLFVFR
jgi:ubiquinone/menaquinone biosynthesis C-methylase UbiE